MSVSRAVAGSRTEQRKLTPKKASFSSLASKLHSLQTSWPCSQNMASLMSIDEVELPVK